MHSNGKTLLLVEDEVLIAMSEKMDLEKYGYTVITTNSGEEAINTFKSRDHIDLILMDINLGSGMDGTETASTILEEQDIPIVFLSSHTSPEMVERTEKITSYGYVVKNSGITVLDASIKMAFRLFDEKQKVKENESRLMDTTELLENMMDAIPDSIGILDDNYTVIRYNEAGYQLLGLTPETTHGRKCYELVHRQEPCEVCAVKHCYKSKKIEEVERYASSIDKWIHLKAYPILDESGNIAQVIEHFRDITEQKHVEEKLRRSENTLQKTFDGIQDGISVLDNDLRILKVNRRITEWYKDELPLIGRKCYEAYQRRETPCPWCPSLKTLSTGETCVEEAPFKQKDGSTRWLEVSSYPLKDNNGNINSVIEHIKNITERKNDEANLRRSRDMLTRTEQIAHIGSWEWFIETDTVTWSEELFRIFKIPPGSKAPSGAEQHKLYHPEDFEKLRQTIKKAISCGDPYEIKLRAIRTDGETRICLARGFPEIDEHGNVIRLYGSLQDITELIKADLAFRENEEYLRTVINATRDGFWIINSRGILEHVNQAYLDMTGYSRDEFLGMHINDIDAIEDPETSRKRMEYIISNGHDLFETKHRRKDGSTFFVEIATTYLDIAGGKFVCFARDITERKHMEDELRESKERLSLALDASMNGYWDWNLENDDIYVSPQYYTMLGYEPGDLSTRRESWMDIMHPEDQEHVLPEILYNISSGEPYSTEFRLRCRDGSWKWISSQGKSYEFTSEGIPTRAVGVYSDIDQQKRAELENIKLTRRINAGLRMGNLAWWEMRLPSGKVIFDERKTEMLGYSPDEFIHYSDFTNLIHPDDYEKAMQAVRDHMDGSADIYDVEYRIQTADGSYRWFHDVGGITERNTETGETLLVGIVQDITEQKRQQEHLQIRNLAIENSLAGIAIADLDYTITYVNPSTLTIWGIDDVNEVIGNSIFDFWEDKETARKDMQDVLSGEKLATERAAFRKDGTKRIIALSASLVTGDKDEPLGIVGTFQDITEKKAAEEGLQAAFEQKQELLRELQHRAKNSFNTIESLMRLKADTLSNMEAKEIISELRSRVRALSELYTMLYDTDSPGTINLGNYCARVAMFSEEMGEHVTINKTMDRVQSNTKDAATVGLIVTELITNAIKHAFPDGRKGTITCSLKKKNEGAVLTVADDGVGIPEDFDLNNTSTMGLMLVQSLVKQLGGVMEIERDSGTRFTVTLPEVV